MRMKWKQTHFGRPDFLHRDANLSQVWVSSCMGSTKLRTDNSDCAQAQYCLETVKQAKHAEGQEFLETAIAATARGLFIAWQWLCKEGYRKHLPDFMVALYSTQTLAPHLPGQRPPRLSRDLVTCQISKLHVSQRYK